MEQTVVQIGNSVGVIIPQALRKSMGIKKGSRVLLEPLPDGGIYMVEKSFKKSKKIVAGKEFKKWLDSVLQEDAEILDELAVR